MKNFRFTIKNKIYGGFILMILIFIINGLVSFYNVQNNSSIVENASEIQRPSSKAINELSNMVTRSKMLITNWVYLQGNNDDDKKKLKKLIEFEYPELRREIEELQVQWESDSQRVAMDTVLSSFEMLIEAEKGVMSQLVTFENYEDPFVKLMAEDAVTSEILPLVTFMNSQLNIAESIQDGVTAKADEDQITASDNMKLTTLISGLAIVVFGILAAFFMARSIVNPVNYMKDVVIKMGEGDLPSDEGRQFNNDEIGEMASAMDNLIAGLRSTTIFAENIGNGIYDAEFEPLSDKDVLGNALIEMRNNLKHVADEDEKRNWATEGLARFGDILRNNNNDLEKLTDDIVRNLVKYLKANQGGLFTMDGEEGEEYLELKACYAWDKKKYLEQKIYKGDGLVGQSWQEMDSIYITDVPADYVSITSGLGDANPTSILIVPLRVNDEIFGVVEIASFNEFEDYEKEFVEKIAESIASTISSVKVNDRTQKLLSESQQMTEEMRAQEEEMRQNMEELQATQEEMQREGMSMEGFITAVNTSIATVEFTPKGDIMTANAMFLGLMGYKLEEVQGNHHSIFVDKQQSASEEYKEFWNELGSGVTKSGVFERVSKKGNKVTIFGNYSPIKDSSGDVVKVIKIAYDISQYQNQS